MVSTWRPSGRTLVLPVQFSNRKLIMIRIQGPEKAQERKNQDCLKTKQNKNPKPIPTTKIKQAHYRPQPRNAGSDLLWPRHIKIKTKDQFSLRIYIIIIWAEQTIHSNFSYHISHTSLSNGLDLYGWRHPLFKNTIYSDTISPNLSSDFTSAGSLICWSVPHRPASNNLTILGTWGHLHDPG